MTDGRTVEERVVGVLGGTGPQGRGLAVRLAAAGQRILLGSRDAERAAEVAAEVAARAVPAAAGAEVSVQGGSNVDVAGAADLVVVAVPYAGHAATLAELAAPLAGKVVADCVVPMGFDELNAYVLDVAPRGASRSKRRRCSRTASWWAPSTTCRPYCSRISPGPTIDGDVMVVGDTREATDTVQALAGRLPGMRGIYAGRLRNARQVEALTINLVSVNRRYKAHAGIRVTDV